MSYSCGSRTFCLPLAVGYVNMGLVVAEPLGVRLLVLDFAFIPHIGWGLVVISLVVVGLVIESRSYEHRGYESRCCRPHGYGFCSFVSRS